MEEVAGKGQIFVAALLGGKRKSEGKKWIVDKDTLSPTNCQSYRELKRCHFVTSIVMRT